MPEKTKVALINLVTTEEHPPISIACLAAYANKFNEISDKYEIILLYPTVGESSVEKLAGEIVRHDPAIVGFSCYLWNIAIYLEVIPAVREKLKDALILLGGPEVYAEVLLEIPGADAVITGEGELAFKELLERRARGLPWDDVKGIALRNGDGVRENPPQPLIRNLDDVPSPYLSGLIEPGKWKRIEYNRGCGYKCSFCWNSNVPFRHYSLKRIEEEILDCVSRGKGIQFAYGSYLNSGEFGRGILKLALKYRKKSGLIMEGVTFVDGNRYDPEFLELLGKAAADKKLLPIEIGLQCSDGETMRLNRRTNNFSALRKNMEALRRLKMPVFLDVMMGLPGDNLLKLAQTLAIAADLQPTFMTVGLLRRIPNTMIFKESEKFQIRAAPLPPRLVQETISSSAYELRKTMLLAQSFSVEYHAANRQADE